MIVVSGTQSLASEHSMVERHVADVALVLAMMLLPYLS